MCDCDVNIFNENLETSNTYSVSNIGGYSEIYSGSQIVGTNTEFQLRTITSNGTVDILQNPDNINLSVIEYQLDSTDLGDQTLVYGTNVAPGLKTFIMKELVAGSNITMTGTASTVIINGTSSGITAVSNVGSGAEIYKGVSGTTAELKSLTSISPNIIFTENINDIQIDDLVPQSYLVVSNYNNLMSPVNINISPGFYAPLTIDSSLIEQTQPYGEGTLSGITTLGFTYTPGPRNKKSVIIPVGLNKGLNRCNSVIKISPDLRYAENYYDYIIGGSTTTPTLKIYDTQNAPIGSDTDLKLHDELTNVTLSVQPKAITSNLNDNILFFVKNTEQTRIYYYDMVTGLETVFINNISNFARFSNIAVIQDLCYDNKKNILYVLPDITNTRIVLINVQPFDRSVGLKYGTVDNYLLPNITAALYTYGSLAVNEDTGYLFLTCQSNTGNTGIFQHVMGSSGFIENFNITFSNARVCYGASGRIIIYNETDNRLYWYGNGGLVNGISPTGILLFTTFIKSICRTFYGIRLV